MHGCRIFLDFLWASCAVCKAKGDNLRVHFKQCREVAAVIRGMSLEKAKSFLAGVLEHKRAVPFRRFSGGCSRHAQGKELKAPGNCVRWPEKATKFFIDLLENAEANAEVCGLTLRLLCERVVQVLRRILLLLLLCALRLDSERAAESQHLLLVFAQIKNLETAKLVVSHVQVQRAPQMNRRTYRAHGRINGMSCSSLRHLSSCAPRLPTVLCVPCSIQVQPGAHPAHPVRADC